MEKDDVQFPSERIVHEGKLIHDKEGIQKLTDEMNESLHEHKYPIAQKIISLVVGMLVIITLVWVHDLIDKFVRWLTK